MAESRRTGKADACRRLGAAMSLEAVKTAPRTDPYVRVILLAAQMAAAADKAEPAGWDVLKRMILELKVSPES